MKLSQFIYDLPSELIAKYPSENRDDSRLLVLHKDTGKIEHKIFKDVINYFKEDDLFVFNTLEKLTFHRVLVLRFTTGNNSDVGTFSKM